MLVQEAPQVHRTRYDRRSPCIKLGRWRRSSEHRRRSRGIGYGGWSRGIGHGRWSRGTGSVRWGRGTTARRERLEFIPMVSSSEIVLQTRFTGKRKDEVGRRRATSVSSCIWNANNPSSVVRRQRDLARSVSEGTVTRIIGYIYARRLPFALRV